jgi:hypothetical protein
MTLALPPVVILTDTESTVARMGRSVATCCLIPFSKHDGDALELCMAAISESTALFDWKLNAAEEIWLSP